MSVITVTADTLNDHIEFGCPFYVVPGGIIVSTLPNVYAPSVYIYVDDDGQQTPDSDDPHIESDDWEAVTGYSGQHGYSGPVMHASEFLGGRMAEDVLSHPGTYTVCSVECLSDDPDAEDIGPAGWVLLQHEDNPDRI